MALITRKPQGVIHHSDQGSQYTSLDFGKRCKEMGVRPSMGSVGDAYDNAIAESFFASLECALIDRRSWKTFAEARMAIFTWIEAWYNPRRRHSGIGQKSPINFEKELQDKDQTIPTTAHEDGLPNGCFAPVDKPPQSPMTGPSACPQASPLGNPAPQHINAVLTSTGEPKIQSKRVREIRVSPTSNRRDGLRLRCTQPLPRQPGDEPVELLAAELDRP